MPVFLTQWIESFRNKNLQRNLTVLYRLFFFLAIVVTIYSFLFHVIMLWEGNHYSWITGFYWTLTVMSTLGFGDITFKTDLGLLFSIMVLLTGIVFMLIVLPYTVIQFFLGPWMEAQSINRAPRELPRNTQGHVILTRYDPITHALINQLTQYGIPYVLIFQELTDALKMFDQGYQVIMGDLDLPETFRKARVENAALVATTASDKTNTNVAFTVRESAAGVPIMATADSPASVDILELAGCDKVVQVGETVGKTLARRIIGLDAKAHVIAQYEQLLIAEASVVNTPLVGKTLREAGLRKSASVHVVGVWERGKFDFGQADTPIHANTLLVLAASREQLDRYNEFFCIYNASLAPIVILGGGRVGQAVGRALDEWNVDYRIVEQNPKLVRNPEKYVSGDAAELEILEQAGIMTSPVVVITTHDDDTNIYITIYCRRLRPDIQIISRATRERNISTLHRAGADVVISDASIGANAIFNLLNKTDVVLMAEGLRVFKLKVPAELVGMSLKQSKIREETGCTVIGVDTQNGVTINPDADAPLEANVELVLLGDVESESRFLHRYRQ